MSVTKYAISPSKQRFRTFYIPNLIPVSIILLDLKLLRTNSIYILHLLLHLFKINHSVIPYFDFSKMSDPVLHDLLPWTLNDCRLLAVWCTKMISSRTTPVQTLPQLLVEFGQEFEMPSTCRWNPNVSWNVSLCRNPPNRFWSQTVWIVCHWHRGNRRNGAAYWLNTAI